MNPIIISFNNSNWNDTKAHKCLCHIMATVTYFCYKFIIHFKTVTIITNNTLTQDTSLIDIYALGDISSIILQDSYFTQLICAKNFPETFVRTNDYDFY